MRKSHSGRSLGPTELGAIKPMLDDPVAPKGNSTHSVVLMGRTQPKFVVRRSSIQGKGVFASRRIRPGTRIIEYQGERVSSEEADRRYDDDHMERHHTFLFTVDEDILIDAAVDGNEARFINHSCDPNCEAVLEDGRVYIEAIKNIQPGVELTYDYHYEREGPYEKGWAELYACHCGAENCRGTILDKPRPPTRRSRRRKKPRR
jgi:SET domain-containing protein